MGQGKCNLLKPVDNLTGTFFMFSQYTQDLTKQYTQCDKYRCVPSKFAALNLDLNNIGNTGDVKLGEIFQNYFENACTFLRGHYAQTNDWNPEYTRNLLFQTLQKYGLMNITDSIVTSPDGQIVSGVSKQLQYIGDINLYSYEELKDGTGYNEIYCYIPNDAKNKDYQLSGEEPRESVQWPDNLNDICGYEGQTPYNNLSWSVNGYTDLKSDNTLLYCIGQYGIDLNKLTLIPQVLGNHDNTKQENSNDNVRNDGEDSFEVNAIVVFYDIVSKNGAEDDTVIYYNVPLGIYFTGKPQTDGTMTNTINKYISSEEVYNQGTSYGLRICSRFLSNPNTTEPIEITATGSSNVSEIAPVLEKMGELLSSIEDVINDDDRMYNMIKDHLAMFKNNKVNVPYVRQVGNKKYWFVNGKNTGAIAECEFGDVEELVNRITQSVLSVVFTKTEIQNILNGYVTQQELERMDFVPKSYVDDKFEELKESLKVWFKGE